MKVCERPQQIEGIICSTDATITHEGAIERTLNCRRT